MRLINFIRNLKSEKLREKKRLINYWLLSNLDVCEMTRVESRSHITIKIFLWIIKHKLINNLQYVIYRETEKYSRFFSMTLTLVQDIFVLDFYELNFFFSSMGHVRRGCNETFYICCNKHTSICVVTIICYLEYFFMINWKFT